MSDKVVLGTRRRWWIGMSWGQLAFGLSGPVLVLAALCWFAGLVRQCGHITDNENVGANFWGTVLFAVVGFVGIAALYVLVYSSKEIVLLSDCPRCGARHTRRFDSASDGSFPTACGVCLAYLRADGVNVREESPTGNGSKMLVYSLAPQRYAPVAKSDEHGFIQFEMPAKCAMCGSHDVVATRGISDETHVPSTDYGIVGELASSAVREAYGGRSFVSGGRAHTGPSDSADNDLALSHLEVPICAKHDEGVDKFQHVLAYKDGQLAFLSYDYYKSFCELNQVPDTPTS